MRNTLCTEAFRASIHTSLCNNRVNCPLKRGNSSSSDPVCAEHVPGHSMEERWLHGAACHGCTLVAETSCEMRNEYLDRALVVPTLYAADAAFFDPA